MSDTAVMNDSASATIVPGAEQLFDGQLLVATDGSESADGALTLVSELRKVRPRRVHLLAVFEPAPLPVPSVDPSLAAMSSMAGDADIRADFFGRVDRQLARFGTGLPPIDVEKSEGSPVRLIVDTAKRVRADVIITGLRLHSIIDRLVGDETALRVTRATDRPVFAVAPSVTHVPRRGVAGIDFSRASLRAAHAAAGIVADGGTLTLLHTRPSLDVAAATEDGIELPYARGVTAALDGLRIAVAAAHPAISVVVERRDGDPAESVLNYALTEQADFMAIGRHHRSAISQAVLGSVATSLLRKAKLSVLVLPPTADDRH